MKNKHNLVFCLEGADGSGKTTQALLLTECIKHNNKQAIYSREPGGSPVGEKLREIFLSHFSNLPTENQILLINLSRKDHIEYTIKPALKNNHIVVLDRYLLSTLVYQGKGVPHIINKINLLHEVFIKNFYPTLTLILNTDSKIALKRLKHRDINNVLDKITLNEHENIKQLYLNQAKTQYKAPYIIINSNETIIELHKNIIKTINNNLRIKLVPLNSEQITKIL